MDFISIGIAIILTIVSIIIGYHFGKKSQITITSTIKSQIKKLYQNIGYQINTIEKRGEAHKGRFTPESYNYEMKHVKKILENYRTTIMGLLDTTWLPGDANFTGSKCPKCEAPTYISDIGGFAFPGLIAEECPKCGWTDYSETEEERKKRDTPSPKNLKLF